MYETITTTDKIARDLMFEDLILNGNPAERQAVRFSGYEPILNENGVQEIEHVWYEKSRPDNFQVRPVYRSTFSVAYPHHIELTGRAARREVKRLKALGLL